MSNQRGTALLNHKWLLNISVDRSELNISFPYLKHIIKDFISCILWIIKNLNHPNIKLRSKLFWKTYFENDWSARYSSKRLVPIVKLSLVKSVSLSTPQSSVNTTCFSPDAASSTIFLINIVSYKKGRYSTKII